MRTVQELVEHLKEHKDAVIILGSGVLEHKAEYSVEDFNSNYTRKALVREPQKLWNFFMNNMYREATSKEDKLFNTIKSLKDITGLVVNQNMIAHTIGNTIDLHGSYGIFMCPKCKTIYTKDYITSKEPYENECECCGATIRPTALLSGERYNHADFKLVEESIANAHTIILIGMDYTEEPLLKLIAQYGDIKAITESKDKVLVSIQTKEEEFDPNEMTHFEFIVRDDIQAALDRLIAVM